MTPKYNYANSVPISKSFRKLSQTTALTDFSPLLFDTSVDKFLSYGIFSLFILTIPV